MTKECFMCKGDLQNKTTNFVADLGECIVIVKGVPSQVCSQCGEVSYSDDVARRLEAIVNKTKISLAEVVTEIAVVDYQKAA